MQFVSKVEKEKHKVQWKIRNFDKIPFMDEIITGPSLTLGRKVRNKWTLLLCKLGEDGDESVGFDLRKEDKNYHYEVVLFTVNLESDDGRYIECVAESVSHAASEEMSFISTRDLTDGYKTIFKSKELTLFYDIQYVFHKQLIKTKFFNLEHRYLLMSMEYLIENTAFSDITLCTSDNATLRCHKAILCCRSHVMNELCKDLKKDDVLHLDIDGKTAKAMMFHIYTRQMPHIVTKEEHQKLSSAAEKFNLALLKSACEDMFKYGEELECLCPNCLYEKGECDEFENNE